MTNDEQTWAIEEMAAAIAIFSYANIKSTKAGPSLREAMQHLSYPNETTQEVIDRLGLETRDADGHLLPLADIVAQLQRADTEHNDYWMLFGIQAGSTISTLVNYGADTLRGLTREVNRSEDRDKLLADTRRLLTEER